MQEVVLGGIVSGLIGLIVGLFLSGLMGLFLHKQSQVQRAAIASTVSITTVLVAGMLTGGILSVLLGMALWVGLSVIATAMVNFAYRAMGDETGTKKG